MPETAKPLAFYDDPFLSRWPAITENKFGNGTLLYEGTWLSDDLQRAMLLRALDAAAIPHPGTALPTPFASRVAPTAKATPSTTSSTTPMIRSTSLTR